MFQKGFYAFVEIKEEVIDRFKTENSRGYALRNS